MFTENHWSNFREQKSKDFPLFTHFIQTSFIGFGILKTVYPVESLQQKCLRS